MSTGICVLTEGKWLL